MMTQKHTSVVVEKTTQSSMAFAPRLLLHLRLDLQVLKSRARALVFRVRSELNS
jgi:hypothetical protein